MLEKLPVALKACPQWILWRLEHKPGQPKPDKVPYSGRVWKCKVDPTDPSQWCDFETCLQNYLSSGGTYSGLGVGLGGPANLGGLDCDGVWNEHGQLLVPQALTIADAFKSYTEYSPSRTGIHVLFRAPPDAARKHNGYELYTRERYFTVTGDSFGDPRDLNNAEMQARALADDIDKVRGSRAYAVPIDRLAPAIHTDEQVLAMANSAANHDKFQRLYYNGDYTEYGNDWSKGDQALVNLLQFYSKSPPQITRMFRASAMGRRAKADRDDYVALMVQKSYDKTSKVNQIPELPVQYEVKAKKPRIVVPNSLPAAKDVFTIPPGGGVVGEIARHIYAQSTIPMVEAALAGALVMMAGICGRQYQVNGSGLNLYMMLLAKTGSGKEAISSGVSSIMDAIVNPVLDINAKPNLEDAPYPAAANFRGPARVTGVGLVETISERETLSMFSIFNEFAHTMKQMADPRGNPGLKDLNDVLLDFYMKSSAGNVYAGSRKADRKAIVKLINAPAFSFVAECTPELLYKYLTEDLISSGLLPRMLIFESPDINDLNQNNTIIRPSHALIQHIRAQMMLVHDMRVTGDRRIEVLPADEAALRLYKDLQIYAHERKRDPASNEVQRQLWNRAHLNSVRIASLVAVGCDPHNPAFTVEQLTWAWKIVTRAIILLLGKFERGEIGEIAIRDDEQTEKLLELVDEWKSYDAENMHSSWRDKSSVMARHAGYVPFVFFSRRCSQVAIFVHDKRGKNTALRQALDVLVKQGDLGSTPLAGTKAGAYYQLT